jgi:hypothetical protein
MSRMFFLSMCDVNIFLTFTSPNMVLLDMLRQFRMCPDQFTQFRMCPDQFILLRQFRMCPDQSTLLKQFRLMTMFSNFKTQLITLRMFRIYRACWIFNTKIPGTNLRLALILGIVELSFPDKSLIPGQPVFALFYFNVTVTTKSRKSIWIDQFLC